MAKTLPVIAIKKNFPANTLAEFIDNAKKNPNRITLGHAGVGSSNYLICKGFIQAADIEVTLVSYRGAAPALNDLMGGQIDGVCDAAASVTSAIQGGLVKGLVIDVVHGFGENAAKQPLFVRRQPGAAAGLVIRTSPRAHHDPLPLSQPIKGGIVADHGLTHGELLFLSVSF